ncbi:MAG: muts domain V-domain-containing protein [Podila humilis]|nr:MAG: muts domain V-domain-containing protein [Podila humilis]
MSQKTLLSFFKLKAVTTPSNNDPSPSLSPSNPLKRKNEPPVINGKSSPTRSRRRLDKTHEIRNAKPEAQVEEKEEDDEEAPLFPQGFSYDPAKEEKTLPIFNEPTQGKPTRSKASVGSVISRFAYQDKNASETEPEPMMIDDPPTDDQAREALKRERFRNKLGNFASPAASTTEAPSAEASSSRPIRKKRQIIDESDDDYGEDHDEDKIVSSPVQTRKPFKPAVVSRTTASKKSKSIYTPLEQQYLEIKEQYPDAILCIEVGYKFRFFGHDAEIASKELSIAHFMDHNFYTASIPTHRLNVHVRRLVYAGHKVGVVKQMETAALKSSGDNKSAPFTRKLTNLYTKATFLESLDQDEEQFQGSYGGNDSSSQYIMCVYEQPQGGTGADEKVKLAVIAVQPATGDIIYDEFLDGHFRNELETRLLHIQPTELIVPVQTMSKATEKLLSHLTASSSQRRAGGSIRGQDDVRIERTEGFVKYDKAFHLVSEFYSSNVKQEQQEKGTQKSETGSESGAPTPMEALLNTVLGLSKNLTIVLSAMITHLTDFGLAPIFRLSKYFECFTSRSHMLLNGNTIANLEIYKNQTDGSSRGSLFSILDHTVTGFGKRLLKKWVGKPLVDRRALQERVDAVEEILMLSGGKNVHLEGARSILKGIIDLEKGICRVHYGKSSPKEFLALLKTFAKVAEVIPQSALPLVQDQEPDFGLTSPVLTKLIGSLPLVLEDCRYFLTALDERAANKDDKLLMFRVETLEEKWPEVIEHRNNIVVTEDDLVTHLVEIRKLMREPRLEYTSVSGIDYLVEVKNKDVAKIPKSWVKISGTKQVSRFHTPTVHQLIQEKAQHQERLALACNKAFDAFQQEFSERYEVFRDLVQSLAVLDCLFSLATVACLPGYVKPEYVDDNDEDAKKDDESRDMEMDASEGHPMSRNARLRSKATLDIKNGRHPMVEQLLAASSGSTFVPNDIQFGRVKTTTEGEKTKEATFVDQKTIILTGPNMGGKSCYIRQVALLCIMAQIGSYLPADSARVSLLDAVYTRMGASDNIVGHESTFMVELQETSDILKMATTRSLVILDELGRGTSTMDGVAIAYAVLKYVVGQIGAITLFVTHYPSLSEVAQEFPSGVIRNYHMGFLACASAEGLSLSDDSSVRKQVEMDETDIVFLYKLVPGVSLKSYGLNVARMARLPGPLIDKARIKSKELENILEQRVRNRQENASSAALDSLGATLSKIMKCSTPEQAQELWDHLSKK